MINHQQTRYLRTLAHRLQPVVWIGQHGLTAAVTQEIQAALEHHELIKVRIRADGREARARIAEQIRRDTGAEEVQRIGNILVLYRPHPDTPVIRLP